ncbi:hypothetical protein ANCCAN_08210 [Ancylostoma caninum]|uniref:Uncharacterized protein n=1 Tax=Ancylostoma caninum TaxID=29170 RepID=A0A368GRS6_ANCCA|nr:hypothetical protein ANCCAN_08210 [Ancylostoma caninum]
MFLGTCDSRRVGGVGVLVNTNVVMNIDSFKQLTTRIGCLRLRRCGSMPAVIIFVNEEYDRSLAGFWKDAVVDNKEYVGLFSISATAQRKLRVQEPPRGSCSTRQTDN